MAEKMTLVPCKECGSKDTSWSCAPRNNGQSVDGRICMREVGMQFYRGCDSCGETLEVIGADEFLVKLNTHLTQPAQAVDVGAMVEALRIAEGCIREICHERSVPMPNTTLDRITRALAGEKAGCARYRLLGPKDVIEPDDEFIDDNAVDWVPVKSNPGTAQLFVGMQYCLGTLKQARRALPTPPTDGEE